MRTSTAACFALALCSFAGCKQPKGVEVEPFELMPAEVDAAFGFDLDALSASPVGAALNLAAATDADISALQNAIPKCNKKLDGFKGVFGINMATEQAFAAMQLEGIGDEDIVRCIEKEIEPGELGVIAFETRGDVRITPQEGGGHLIILNKNTIVMADGSFDKEVFNRIENTSARELTPLMKAAKEISAKDMWVAYALNDSDRAELTDVPGTAGVQLVTAATELEDGIALSINFVFDNDENTKALLEAGPELIEAAKGELPGMGLPKSIGESIKLTGDGTTVTLSMAADKEATGSLITVAGTLLAE